MIAIANDVVYALVVMLLFAIPFAFLCERLFLSGNTIGTRATGFGAIFSAVFIFLFFFHPAFSLATTPAIIFLAFAILVMSGAVIILAIALNTKWTIRLATLGIRKVDARLGTLLATFLGISNMHGDRRTFLTGSTVVLMTFILNLRVSASAAAS